MFRIRLTNKSSQQSGFVLPTVIILTLVMSFVAYAALLQSNNNLNISYKQSYIQIARVASKSAIDYAQEQFDNAPCGNYTGSAEQTLMSNSRYRVTMKSEVIDTSADGYEKTIKGTGAVYLPHTSTTAKYVFDIKSQIVRTYALCKTPGDFNPTLWLDANDSTTLLKGGTVTTNTVTYNTNYGSIFDNSRDTLKERADDGSQPLLAWQSRGLDMHTCNTSEFISALICVLSGTKYLYDGAVFQNVNLPKDSTITSANLQFTGCNASGGCSSGNVGGSVTHRTYGLYNTASNPHLGLFTSSGVSQLRNRLSDPNLRTNAYSDTTTTNFPPGNTTNFNVTNVVQEMVNNPNWTPGNMGFGIKRQSGSGSRRADKNGIKLVITYTTAGATTQANNGDSISEWHDKSGNGNHAIATHGTAPVRVDNQINGKPIVRFAGGDMLSSLTNALSGKRDMSAAVVIRPNFSSSSADARLISGMDSNYTNDTAGTHSIIPLLRYGSGSGFSSVYASLTAGNRLDYTCGASCANQPYLIGAGFTSQNTSNTLSTLKGNGAMLANKIVSPTTASPPYTYSIDQLYIGGNRSGAMPGSGTNYMYGDFAEIIVYDHVITCREGEAIEEYLRAKWNIYNAPASTSCPEDTVPTL
jgi:hypothetical protein